MFREFFDSPEYGFGYTPAAVRLQFGEFSFDRDARTLTRDGRAVDLSPQAFQLLQELLERRPRVVPRRELHDLLWPDTFVSETSLPRLVSELRKALGDTRGAGRMIRTVHGFGYGFAAEAGEPDAPRPARSSCSVTYLGVPVALREGENVVGRGAECQVRVDAHEVSRLHARILVAGDKAVIEDLASKNGTFVNGARVAGPRRLEAGDEIGLGSALLSFASASDSHSTATVAPRR